MAVIHCHAFGRGDGAVMSAQTIICGAIRNRERLGFWLRVWSDVPRREVEPHLLGYDDDGELTLGAWQLAGGSGKGWRRFHVAKLTGLSTTGTNFSGARSRYDPNHHCIVRVP